MVRGRPHLVVATVVALVLAACSADPGPPETSAADAPVRATTTTLPPPPTQERVALESAVLAGEGDQRMVAAATGVVPGEGVRVVAVGSSEGRPVAWWSPDGRTWQRSLPDRAQFGEDASFADVAADPVAGGWVAVGAEGGQAAAWLSPDGVSWERATVDPGPGMSRIGATGAGFVAFGTGGGGDPAPRLAGQSRLAPLLELLVGVALRRRGLLGGRGLGGGHRTSFRFRASVSGPTGER